jgi:hypothetical protein
MSFLYRVRYAIQMHPTASRLAATDYQTGQLVAADAELAVAALKKAVIA